MLRSCSGLSGKLRVLPCFHSRTRCCAAGLPIIGIARLSPRHPPLLAPKSASPKAREVGKLAEASSPGGLSRSVGTFSSGQSRHSRGASRGHSHLRAPEGAGAGQVRAAPKCSRRASEEATDGAVHRKQRRNVACKQASPPVRGHGALPNCLNRVVPEGTIWLSAPPTVEASSDGRRESELRIARARRPRRSAERSPIVSERCSFPLLSRNRCRPSSTNSACPKAHVVDSTARSVAG